MTDILLNWSANSLIHSSLLVGGLWAAERLGGMNRLRLASQETLWRLALLGGLFSASLGAGLASNHADAEPIGAFGLTARPHIQALTARATLDFPADKSPGRGATTHLPPTPTTLAATSRFC
jgi:hypothetical protein